MFLPDSLPPPSRELWENVSFLFQFFPLGSYLKVTVLQWFISFYPAGKTSIKSRLNLPGKIAWISMEVPGFLTVLYCMNTIPRGSNSFSKDEKTMNRNEIPTENVVMAAMFIIHYIYRAIIGPLLNPSMSPIHISIWGSAVCFQLMNGISIGGYLAGYGSPLAISKANSLDTLTMDPISNKSQAQLQWNLGILIWVLGFLGNIFHDGVLRDIRRSVQREKNIKKRITVEAKDHPSDLSKKFNIDKHYGIPSKGLFQWILFPHYLCEWVEWMGWWIAGGSTFLPAQIFLINEITTMLPRAIQGRKWYLEKFGIENLANRKAILPGIL
ncbi:hypothetical protein Golomagni_04772 [Golovinomyces magnicellulatus]|nr:hypothetical protein Golomagni_04772 [Golovinomyces magnicellulatus]